LKIKMNLNSSKLWKYSLDLYLSFIVHRLFQEHSIIIIFIIIFIMSILYLNENK